ncbi:MAG TPA: cytochrome c biogenesis protein ResB [Opitutaceae bacterium]|nr:cytochrome c biogenesis protein ResB [Opitutaceae bacterium]
MRALLRTLVERLASLRITVVLLVLAMVLVVIATLDQVHLGIWAVQAKYFRSFVVVQQLPGTGVSIPFFPGGYLIGGALLINLLCAQFLRFTLTWRNLGLHFTHFGIILLLVGELLTGLLAVESHLTLDTGDTKNYAEASFERELAVIDVTDPAFDQVWAVPLSRLSRREPIALPGCPLTLLPLQFHENANFFMRRDAPNAPASPATLGFGPAVVVQPAEPTYRPNEENAPTAFVEFRGPDGPVGVMLATLAIERPQTFTAAGRTYAVVLRRTRIYFDFSLSLLEFRHDKYPGTEIPRNFSSRVRLRSAEGAEDRQVRIYMNNPLRHGGYTFYQSGFKNNDRTTILQVVRNPGWLLPYIACVISGLGLLYHFILTLAGFLQRRRATAATTA